MSGDTVRPPNIANKMAWQPQKLAAMFKDYVQSSWNLYIYDLQTRLNKCAKQLFLIQNRLAVTANQTWRQSRQIASKPVLSIFLTHHSQTWNIDSWHHSGDIQTIWWPLISGGCQTGSELISMQGLHASKLNLAHSLMSGCLFTCVSVRDIVPNTPMYLCHLFIRADDNAPLPLGRVIFPFGKHWRVLA